MSDSEATGIGHSASHSATRPPATVTTTSTANSGNVSVFDTQLPGDRITLNIYEAKSFCLVFLF